jgi:Peptidase family S41
VPWTISSRLYFPEGVPHFGLHMRLIWIRLLAACLLFLFVQVAGVRAATNAVPEFRVVFDLVRAHLAGVSEAELNRAAVEGLLAGLRGKVRLVTDTNLPLALTNAPLVSKTNLLDEDIAYVRVSRVGDGLAGAVSAAYGSLRASKKLKGLVLDLRFTGGEDFAAAAAVADVFIAKERPLLDWGHGVVRSEAKQTALTLPVAVLMNRETTGAAEALAAVLRDAGVALLLGAPTAGAGMVMSEYPLPDGQWLRIAAEPVKFGDGAALSPQGVKPDIEVKVTLDEDRVYQRDAYGLVAKPAGRSGAISNAPAGTNVANRRPRITEADLVRERREGRSLEEFTPVRDREPPKAQITDPTLARAVDLLKGLAVVRRSQP